MYLLAVFFLLGVLNFGLRKQREEEKMGNCMRFDVDEAQLHVVFGVVGSCCSLWGRFADVTRPTEEFGSRLARRGDAETTVALLITHTHLTFMTSPWLLEKNCISNSEI